jgi:hypothetical protein
MENENHLLLVIVTHQQDGIGNMKITPSGIQLNGEAMVLDTLITSQISAKHGQPLVFDSSQNITLNARDAQGRIANKIFLGKTTNNNRLYILVLNENPSLHCVATAIKQ